MNDYSPEEESQVISVAQTVWAKLFKSCRRVRGERFHKGRPQDRAGNSEAAWLRKRHAVVVVAATAGRGPDPSEEGCPQTPPGRGPDPPVWTESHEKERTYQQQKRRKIQIEAFQRGSLLPDEVDDALPLEAAQADKVHRATALQKHRAAPRRATQHALKLEDFMKQTPRTIFIEPDAARSEERIRQLRQLQGVQFSERRCASDVFVAADPTRHGLRTAWAVRLAGGWVVAPETLLHPTMQGAALRWESALVTRRRLYWTLAACRAFPKVVQPIKDLITQTGRCQWRLLDSEDEYLEEKTKAIASKRSPVVIAIGLEAELQALSDKLAGPRVEPAKRHVFQQAGALKFLERLAACHTGATCVRN